MTAYEVARTLFWIVAGGYVLYVGWSIRRAVAYRSARHRHPVNREQPNTSALP